jgi:hypothetical protein
MLKSAALLAIVVVAVMAAGGTADAVAQGGDRDCVDFGSQADAQSFFLSQGGPTSDPHALDADGDGVACETLPCPCSSGGPVPPSAPPAPPPETTAPTCPDRTAKRASDGSVTVELSYTKRRVHRGGTSLVRYRNLRTCITRDGQVVYDEPTGPPCDDLCQPSESALTGDTVGFRDLDGDGVREIVVGLFTGGANCCVITFVYGLVDGALPYRRAALDAGSGYAVRDYDADGRLELIGGDYSFKYKFACGACSLQPIRIWQYEATGIVEATRAFPGQIRADAGRALRLYRRTRHRGIDFVRGTLTGYVADLCLLERCHAGYRVVRRAIRRGDLSRSGQSFELGPFESAYLRALKGFLRRTGYAS